MAEKRTNGSVNNETSLVVLTPLIKRYWWLVLLVSIVAIVGGIVLAYTATPIYRAETLLSYSAPEGSESGGILNSSGLGGFAALAGISLGESGNREEAISVLQSRSLAREFIETHDLLPELFPEVQSRSANELEDMPTINDAVRYFDGEIRTVFENDRRLIVLRIEWRDPSVVAAWANGLVELTNNRLRSEAISEARSSIDYLEEELDRSSLVGLNQAIYGLIENQIQRITLANVRENYAFRPIDPAVTPESDEYVRPNRPLIVLAAAMSGVLFGILMAYFFGLIRAIRNA